MPEANKLSSKKPIVFLICPGLGRVNRGYESFTRECFDSLKDSTAFDLYLVKGGGKSTGKEIVLFNLHRNGTVARLLEKIIKKNAYYIEQLSFLLAMLLLIAVKKPALIYYSDYTLGSYLWHLRKKLKFSYKLLYANGAPNGPPYKTEDHVQQLLPIYYSIGVKCDGAGKHTCLPYAFSIDMHKRLNSVQRKNSIREQLGFSPEQKIILSVGVVNMWHKRMDYLINEIGRLDENYYLIMIGQNDDETDDVIKQAEEKLPGRYTVKNVAHGEVGNYYIAADYFVLASLLEGFPRVTVEALSYGLPCIVHDYIVMRQILKSYGTYVDMRFDGLLAECLRSIGDDAHNKENAIWFAYNSYAWEQLKPVYENMIVQQLNA